LQLGFNDSCEQTISTNYFGPRRVVEAFGKFLKRPGGRIVNQASASGPNYVSSCNDKGVQQKLAKPWTIAGGIAEVDDMAQTMISSNDANPYGASKALLNAYTCLLAKTEPDLVVNSCTPGWILTDMTAGSAASGTPSKGAGPACYLLMDEETVPKQPTGRYYGSDCVRSPISFYRGPGEPPYESDEDLVGLPETAKKEAPLLL
jgi:NAD(P)-dependent dehydrogenase (short-subunit alcohol dehydrogenase family)